MCEDSDLHARTESGWVGISAARCDPKGLLSAARAADIMPIVSSTSVAFPSLKRPETWRLPDL
jgi:hypothetical protein